MASLISAPVATKSALSCPYSSSTACPKPIKFPLCALNPHLGQQWIGLKHVGISISPKSLRSSGVPFSLRKRRCRSMVVRASLFGVGAPEALVIGVVALLVFGPKGLAEVMEFFPQSDEPPSDTPPLSEPDYELIPKPGMVFKSEEEVYNFYLQYGREVGFGIRRKGAKKDDDGKLKYYIVACSREGTCKSVGENAFNPRPSKKTNCKARINCMVNAQGEFTISSVKLEHNHDLSPTKSHFFQCNKNIDAYVKRRLETNDQAGIRVSNNFHSLAMELGGYENLTFTEKDCRNHLQKVRQHRLGVGDAASLSMYFACMQQRNPNFFYMLDLDDENRLRNVFWADARSRAAYESFGDVISFDTTYLTNRYDMPFAPFVGVNHHGQTVLLGCGLLSNEEADTYIWLFKAWLVCMSNPPNAIITDQCRSIQKAVLSVFPNSHHRLCLWHIMKKLPEKLGSRHDYKPIKKVLKRAVYESIDLQEFEENWGNMITDFDLQKNTWLSGLYEDRHRWVPVFVRGIFWAGMSTTQRSESINAFFDGYVGPKTSLKQFVEQYDNALKCKIEKENKADFASFNSRIPLITNFNFEKQFQDAYTNELFRLFQDEVRGVVSVNLQLIDRCGEFTTYQVADILSSKNEVFRRNVTYCVYYDWKNEDLCCSCRLFQFKGIICRHIVKVLIQENIHQVPSEYVLRRWRKDVRHKHTYVKNCYDDDMDDQFRMRYNHLNSEWAKFPEVGASSVENYECLLSSLDEAASKLSLGDSTNWKKQSVGTSSTIMTEDCQNFSSPLKVRTKGRPPSKRKISTLEQKMKNKMSAKVRKTKKDHSESENQFGTQESQFGPSEPSTVNQFGTQESLLNDDNDEEDEDEHGETVCGNCGDNYASDEFWICCDICAQWFHGKCVHITPARAEHMKQYKCSACSKSRARRHF